MNKEAAALLSILSDCDPQDAALLRESKIQQITHLDAYIELEHQNVFSNQFQQFFALEKLQQYSNAQLEKLLAAVPVIPGCLKNILFSLNNGAAPSLTEDDVPNYFNKAKLERLSAKLESNTGENYTNIQAEDYMAIFDPATVKNASDCFSQLPANTKNYAKAIADTLGTTKYCIAKADIEKAEAEHGGQVEALNAELEALQRGKKRHRLFKIFAGITFLFFPSFLGRLTGALSPSAIGMCTLVELILVLVYWVLG